MEKQLFEDGYEWNQQDTAVFTFFPVTLKVDIGSLKKGDKFDCAAIDFEKGILEFFSNAGEKLAFFKLTLNVI